MNKIYYCIHKILFAKLELKFIRTQKVASMLKKETRCMDRKISRENVGGESDVKTDTRSQSPKVRHQPLGVNEVPTLSFGCKVGKVLSTQA